MHESILRVARNGCRFLEKNVFMVSLNVVEMDVLCRLSFDELNETDTKLMIHHYAFSVYGTRLNLYLIAFSISTFNR